MKQYFTIGLFSILTLLPSQAEEDVEINQALREIGPVLSLLIKESPKKAKAKLSEMENDTSIDLKALTLARLAVKNSNQEPTFPSPAKVDRSENRISISDCKWEEASVEGINSRIIPRRNTSLSKLKSQYLLRSREGIHRHGLFARPDSEYKFDLGGKWDSVTGTYSLFYAYDLASGELKQPRPFSHTIFKILADGKEVLKGELKGNAHDPKKFSINVRGVKTLTFITEHPKPRSTMNNASWLDVELIRPRHIARSEDD